MYSLNEMLKVLNWEISFSLDIETGWHVFRQGIAGAERLMGLLRADNGKIFRKLGWQPP